MMILAAVVSCLALILLVLVAPAHAARVLPDLRTRGLTDFRIEVTSIGEKRLRSYPDREPSPCPFEVYAKRPNIDTANMAVFQRVHNTAGGYRSISVAGTHAFYSGMVTTTGTSSSCRSSRSASSTQTAQKGL